MKEEYKPKTLEQMLGYLIEEAGEVLTAIGKSRRCGLFSSNPELPPDEQEKNGDWILRELKDLRRAIDLVEPALRLRMNTGDRGSRE